MITDSGPTTHPATLRERIEKDRVNQPGPAHSTGSGTTRISALIDAAKARLAAKD